MNLPPGDDVEAALRSPAPFDAILAVVAPGDMIHFENDPDVLRSRYYNFYAAYGRVFRPRTMLEIGVRRGYSAFSTVRGAGGSVERFVGLDFEAERTNEIARATLAAEGVQAVAIMAVDTQLEFPRLDETFALVHIDGDHSMRGAFTDLANSHRHLAPGGTVVVDDHDFPPIAAAVDAFLASQDRPVRCLRVSNYRGHVVLWPDRCRRSLAEAFACLPPWATALIDIEDSVLSARLLGGVAGDAALRPLSATAFRVLGEVGSGIGIQRGAATIPSGALAALQALLDRAVAIAEALTARPDASRFLEAVARLRSDIRYAAERAAVSVPETYADPLAATRLHADADLSVTKALLREFSVHAANVALDVSIPLLGPRPVA